MTDFNGQSRGEVVLYQTPDGTVELDVRLEQESLWLSINQMASLFERDKSVISRHLRKVFQEGELDRGATVAKNATVQMEGTREVARDIRSIAIPPLGCGLGGLAWPEVRGLMATALAGLKTVEIIIFEPNDAHRHH